MKFKGNMNVMFSLFFNGRIIDLNEKYEASNNPQTVVFKCGIKKVL